jgi:hypothetical protein
MLMEDGIFSILDPQPLSVDRSALRHFRRQPPCRAQQTRVAVTRPDELHANGKIVGALQEWQTDRRHAAQSP